MLPAIMGAVGALGEALKTPSATPGNVEQTMAAKTTLNWGSSFAVGSAEANSEPTNAVSDGPATVKSGGLSGTTWAWIGGGVLVLVLGGVVVWKLSRR
jgi:hypothetical protein